MGSRFARALRRSIVNLIIVVVGVCVALLIAEVALRALKGRHPIATARYGKIPDVTERGTYLPWDLRPGAVDRQVDPYGEFDVEFRINSSGLRDDGRLGRRAEPVVRREARFAPQ
jgi:hypothetical protein